MVYLLEIALGSVIGKVIDNILLEKHRYVLTSYLQYGFKAKHSTTHCTFVIQENLEYYINNNSSMLLVLLDPSRAFDRVQYQNYSGCWESVVCVHLRLVSWHVCIFERLLEWSKEVYYRLYCSVYIWVN